jgi:hypothetical protein
MATGGTRWNRRQCRVLQVEAGSGRFLTFEPATFRGGMTSTWSCCSYSDNPREAGGGGLIAWKHLSWSAKCPLTDACRRARVFYPVIRFIKHSYVSFVFRKWRQVDESPGGCALRLPLGYTRPPRISLPICGSSQSRSQFGTTVLNRPASAAGRMEPGPYTTTITHESTRVDWDAERFAAPCGGGGRRGSLS